MNFKKMLVVALVAGLVTMPLVLATPMQAYITGDSGNTMLRTQKRDQLRPRDCECDCTCDGTGEQIRARTQIHECPSNGIENCTLNMEQYRYQHQNKKLQP